MKITVVVKPGSKKGNMIVGDEDGSFVAFLRQKPVDGAANIALVELLSDYFDTPRNQIKIVTGNSGRRKIVQIGG